MSEVLLLPLSVTLSSRRERGVRRASFGTRILICSFYKLSLMARQIISLKFHIKPVFSNLEEASAPGINRLNSLLMLGIAGKATWIACPTYRTLGET